MPSRRRASPSASPSGDGSRESGDRRPRRSPPRPPGAARPGRARRLPTRRPARAGGGDRPHARRLAGAPDAVELTQAGDRRDERIRSGRDDHVLGRVTEAVDLDAPGPASRPAPRSRSMPWSASQRSWPASVWSETMKSRHASAAWTSTSAVPRLARAVNCFARRSSDFDGCTPSRSTRRRPAHARRRRRADSRRQGGRQCSPGAAPPRTITS